MNSIELLSPVGDFECLKAAVQNGANAVYLGASDFSARASAKNFNMEELEKAINYATLRNVDVHLALNTLIKNNEFDSAVELAKNAYELGVSAIIVQDFGLASTLLKYLPNLPIHASTQMSIHNLKGALEAQSIGFKRVVLSRELSLDEIRYIKDNTNIELETFIHGALCISYSGQCLLSSMIGGRSGNRGKCAQACRLPYELIKTNKNDSVCIDKGYLLSPRDLCGLEFIPDLIDIGVTSLKIEGRMKTPEYVATVTRIYRKYIDLAISKNKYIIDNTDKKDLMQVFNRGGFSTGHLLNNFNTNLIYKEKPNNMGIYIGNVSHYNASKGHITLNLNDKLCIGDTIALEHETGKYRISELMIKNKNIDVATAEQIVKIGRMKGNIKPGDKIYKLESKSLLSTAKSSYASENIKNKLTCDITIKEDTPIHIDIEGLTKLSIDSNIYPSKAINNPITKDRIITQFSKTGNTPFEFENINITLDNNLYVNISDINELRRMSLHAVEEDIIRSRKKSLTKPMPKLILKETNKKQKNKKISLLLNTLDINTNYSLLEKVDNVYIPLKYFINNDYSNILKSITSSFNTYIYMPTVIKSNYRNLFINSIDTVLAKFNIKGFVLSNIGTIEMLKDYKYNYEFVGNYTLNVFNNASISAFHKLGLNRITLSPELNELNIKEICCTKTSSLELIVYGRTPIMTCGYCVLGNSNKCYPKCSSRCKKDDKFYLKDRLNFSFRILPDNLQTITTIYNSKITSISYEDLNVDSIRIDILDENILEINKVISLIKTGKRFEGKNYTNGNFNRDV